MKPILFNTPMVQAILEGRKTQTRRVVNPQPIKVFYESNGEVVLIDDGRKAAPPRPYCEGDILYVREKWVDVPDGGYLYRADPMYDSMEECDFAWDWRLPSRMPKEAARLFLKVTRVRVERVREISLDDKLAEGVCDCARAYPCAEKDRCFNNCFMRVWDTLYAKDGYGWDANPYVWVIEFERTEASNE